MKYKCRYLELDHEVLSVDVTLPTFVGTLYVDRESLSDEALFTSVKENCLRNASDYHLREVFNPLEAVEGGSAMVEISNAAIDKLLAAHLHIKNMGKQIFQDESVMEA